MDNDKKSAIESLNNNDLEATASFKDIMSRKEYKEYLNSKKELEKTDKLEKTIENIYDNQKDVEPLENSNIDDSFLNKKELKKHEKELKKHEKELKKQEKKVKNDNPEPKDKFNLNSEEKLEITNSFDEILGKNLNDKLEEEKNSNELSFKHKLKIDNHFDTSTNIKVLEKPKRIDELSNPTLEDKPIKNKKVKKNSNEENIKKSSNDGFLTIILLLIFIVGLGFLGYTLFIDKDNPKQLYQIINSSSISFLALIMLITVKAKNGLKKFLQVITTLLLIAYIIVTVLITLDILKIPTKEIVKNFVNKNVTSAMKWADKNDIDLNIEYDFSESIDKNTIINQNVKPNTLVSKVKDMDIVVSEGPNYDLKVELPDMVGWDIDEVVKKIDELKMNNISIEYEFNDDTDRDIAFEQSKKGNMTRNNPVTIKFSLGNEKDLKPVNLKDLEGLNEFKATLWLKRNGIKYEISYEYSDKVEYGKVISTDPKKGTKIEQKKDKVKLIISKGPKIKVPDLSKMTLSEISAWANKYHLKVTYDSEYDDTIKEGKVKRSNIKNGDTIDQGLEIHIILSKGKLKMINYGDNDANKIKEFAKKYNLPIEVTDEFSDDIAAGKIIKVSHKPNAIIKNSDTIKLTISKGKATKIPNFVGMSLSEAKKSCSSNKLSCSYEYAYSDESEDTIIYQNKASGQQVIENAGLVLTVSKGSAPEGESNYTPPTNKQSNSSGSNNQKPAPVVKPTCKTGKLLFGAGSTGGQTKAMMQEANSKIGASITYTFVTSCSNGDTANGSVCPESTAYYGATLSSCNSYKAVIVNY